MDIQDCIPKDKFDEDAVARARAVGFPALNPILSELLAWLQDANWPVARPMASLLAVTQQEIVPYIKEVLNSEDGIWKYWTIDLLVDDLSQEVRELLQDELFRLAEKPTQNDRLEGVDVVARRVLMTHFE